jgi:hypothetical protein
VPKRDPRSIGTERDAKGEMLNKGLGYRERLCLSNQGLPVVLVSGQHGFPQ